MDHNTNGPKLDLRLQLSPPRPNQLVESPNRSVSSKEMSPPRSCLSSEETQRHSSSPETPSMMLAGCPRCLMYVMLSGENPKCPKCKSTVLLHLLHEERTNKTKI